MKAHYIRGYVSPDFHIGEDTRLEPRFFVRKINGHFAIGRQCTLCAYGVTKAKERRPGRGWGMREGGILRGKMIQHVKAEHGKLIAEANALTGKGKA